MAVGVFQEKEEARVEAVERCEWAGEERLVDAARSGDCVNRVIVLIVSSSFTRALDIVPLLFLHYETFLEIFGSASTKFIPAAHDVTSVRINVGVEVCEEGEHLCCVASTAEDDKEVGRGAAFAR